MLAHEFAPLRPEQIFDITPTQFLYDWEVYEQLEQLRGLLANLGYQQLEGKTDIELAEIAVQCLHSFQLHVVGKPGRDNYLNNWLVSGSDYAGLMFNAQAMVAAAQQQQETSPPPAQIKEPRITHLRWSEARKAIGMPVNLIFSAQNFTAGDEVKVTIYQTPKQGEKQELAVLEHTLFKSSKSCSLTWHVQPKPEGDDVLLDTAPEVVAPLYFLFDVEINGVRSETSDPLYTSTYFEYTIMGPHDLPVCVDDSTATLHDKGKKKTKRWRESFSDFTQVPLHESKIESWYEIHKTQLCDDQDNVLDEQKFTPGFETPLILPAGNKAHYRVKSEALFPQVIINLREDASKSDPNARHVLRPEEIEYFKANGNNATVFIHGFNVGYGEPGSYPDKFDKMDTVRPSIIPYELNVANFKSSHKKSTVVQRAEDLRQRFPELADQSFMLPEKINGTGAHGWFNHMEYQLNLAASSAEGLDWDKYTRTINVAWSGDVFVPNYLAAEYYATTAGVRLSILLKQLIDKGISVNIVAHSLGARVAIVALDTLGDLGEEETIDHVFLWQPACPDTVLSPNKESDTSVLGNWHFPHAHLTAKKFVVLHTRHDNILGKHNIETRAEDLKDFLLNKEHFLEAILELKIPRLDITIPSPYKTATEVGVAPETFAHLLWAWEFVTDRIEKHMQEEGFWQRVLAKWLTDALKLEADIAMDKSKGKKKGFDLDPWLGRANSLASAFVATAWDGSRPPRPALGWAGIEKAMQFDSDIRLLYNSGKLTAVDQGKWLVSHSAMKIPTRTLKEEVYKKRIMGQFIKQNSVFGTYT